MSLSVSGAAPAIGGQEADGKAGAAAGSGAPGQSFTSFMDALAPENTAAGDSSSTANADGTKTVPSGAAGARSLFALLGKAAGNNTAVPPSSVPPGVPPTTAVQPEVQSGWAVSPRHRSATDDDTSDDRHERRSSTADPSSTDAAAIAASALTVASTETPVAPLAAWWASMAGGAAPQAASPTFTKDATAGGRHHASSSTAADGENALVAGASQALGLRGPSQTSNTPAVTTAQSLDAAGQASSAGNGDASADTGETFSRMLRRAAALSAANGTDAAAKTQAATVSPSPQATSAGQASAAAATAATTTSDRAFGHASASGAPAPAAAPATSSVATQTIATAVSASSASMFGSAATEATGATASAASVAAAMPEATSDIVQAIHLQASSGGGTAEIRLEPKFLGDVTVSVHVDQGQVTARLEADAPLVREWLQANQSWLRDRLADQNLTLNRLEIAAPEESRGSSRQESSNQQQASSDNQPRQPRRQPADTDDVFDIPA